MGAYTLQHAWEPGRTDSNRGTTVFEKKIQNYWAEPIWNDILLKVSRIYARMSSKNLKIYFWCSLMMCAAAAGPSPVPSLDKFLSVYLDR